MKWIVAVAIVAVPVSGCAGRVGPSLEPSPAPYVEMGVTADEAWSASVDYLIDNGIEFDFLDNELRVATADILLARGPRDSNYTRVEAIGQLADCGRLTGINAGPIAGTGDLFASIAIRVVEDREGAGWVKVALPKMWSVPPASTRMDRCVSRGVFEGTVIDEIRSRLTPPIVTRD